MEKNTALETLTDLHKQARRLELDTTNAVMDARKNGASWTEIGESLGVSKQAAAKKYGPKEDQARRQAQWEADNPEKVAEINAKIQAEADERHRRLIAKTPNKAARETLREMWNVTDDAMAQEDQQGTSVTPSIFVDPLAKFPNNKELWPWIHALTADSDKYEQDPSYPAQPGTGKGPHECPRCGQNNHHGPQRFTIKFLRECQPTRYDPPATADTMAEWKASK